MLAPSDFLLKLSPILSRVTLIDKALFRLSQILQAFENPNVDLILYQIGQIVELSETPDDAILNLKNLILLGFKEPDVVLAKLVELNHPKLAATMLYLRKCLDSTEINTAFEQLVQIAPLVREDFLMHLSSGLTHIQGRDRFIAQLRQAIQYNANLGWEDTFTKGQMRSKQWLVEQLYAVKPSLGTLFVEGGWVGSLSYMISEHFEFEKIRSFDIDESCSRAADLLNLSNLQEDWRFKAATRDMLDQTYDGAPYEVLDDTGRSVQLGDSPDVIINTSSEHLDYQTWFARIPKGKLVVIQNNNFVDGKHHVNCQESLQAFEDSIQFSELLYKGELQLDLYTRYMLIGVK